MVEATRSNTKKEAIPKCGRLAEYAAAVISIIYKFNRYYKVHQEEDRKRGVDWVSHHRAESS